MRSSRGSSWHGSVLRLVALLILGPWAAAAAQAGALWFSDPQGLHRVDTASSAVVANAPAHNVVALATSARDASAWVLTTGELMKIDASGAQLIDLDFPHLPAHFDLVRRIVIDSDDDSIWVAGGNVGFHLSANAGLLGAFVLRSQVEDIALAGDGTLWVMGDEELATFSSQGHLLSHADLSSTMQQASFLALDEANSAVWLGGSRKLFQISASLPVHTLHTITTPETIRAMALASDSSTLSVAGSNTLTAYRKDGTSAGSTSLAQLHLSNPQALAYDGSAQGLWLGHDRGLSRFSAAGQFVLTLPASVRVGAIGVAGGTSIVPLLVLVAPANNAVTNNPLLPIRLHYDAACGGQPCGYPSSVFAAYLLTATLNGTPIGGQFVFDPATNDAVYTPASRYADGVNRLVAFVTDGSGQVSATLNAQFTVDTVAPHFNALAPTDGTTVATSSVTLTGGLDDLTGHVLLESFSGASFAGANPQGTPFSYAITLQPGANAFRLTATDPAGNASVVSFTYVFSTLSITVTSPTDGATIDADRVTVTGTFSGAPTATIAVNGVAATVSGNTFTAADVPLHFGANTLTVTGSTAQGASATRTLTVTSTAPAITVTAPAQGATLGGDRVLVTGRIQAAPRAGANVNGVVASVDTAGNYYAVVPLTAGPNSLTATVTESVGLERDAQHHGETPADRRPRWSRRPTSPPASPRSR